MKTLIVGDLHHAPNLDEVEQPIARERADTVVFLGDYFDQWDDSPADAERTAVWLKHSLAQPCRVHLPRHGDLLESERAQ